MTPENIQFTPEIYSRDIHSPQIQLGMMALTNLEELTARFVESSSTTVWTTLNCLPIKS